MQVGVIKEIKDQEHRVALTPAGQGHSVFECNTDESQCLRRLGSQPAARRRNVGMTRPSQQPNGG
ncbi:MAG TPA: hypothetical protein VLQ80_12650, partial [Candidatus Saccharimonadia bacterium]|nr:hypothetical protein [Candidatus Saccharimonadia bacterium]